MKNKKGFTLVELLAVIVILALVALITTPIIIKVMEDARKNTFKNSVEGLSRAIQLDSKNNNYEAASYTVTNGVVRNSSGVKINTSGGSKENGTITINDDGNIFLAVNDGSWCATNEEGKNTVKVDKYIEDECKIKLPSPAASSTIIDKNTSGNTEGLYTDDKGNIRYAGNNTVVKNYVRYNNELWRIIGVFDGKLKIMRESATNKAWNSTTARNNWATSSLRAYLNGEYYNSLTDEAKNMIEKTKYYLGGHTTTSGVMKNAMYDYERGTEAYGANPTDWTGKVALMYASDYGYAASSECTSALYHYEESNCKNNNWMYNAEYEWLLTPKSDTSSNALLVHSSGFIYFDYDVTYSHVVRPALHLKQNISIAGGDGTQTNPYLLTQ